MRNVEIKDGMGIDMTGIEESLHDVVLMRRGDYLYIYDKITNMTKELIDILKCVRS